MLFLNRFDAGRQLAARLTRYAGRDDVIVLASTARRCAGRVRGGRGARRTARRVPRSQTRRAGARGTRHGCDRLRRHSRAQRGSRAGTPAHRRRDRARVEEEERHELDRRKREYRAARPPLDVRGKTAILVDDGLATGSSMRTAIAALRRLRRARIVVAVPVGTADTCAEFDELADETICAREPDPFYAVGT